VHGLYSAKVFLEESGRVRTLYWNLDFWDRPRVRTRSIAFDHRHGTRCLSLMMHVEFSDRQTFTADRRRLTWHIMLRPLPLTRIAYAAAISLRWLRDRHYRPSACRGPSTGCSSRLWAGSRSRPMNSLHRRCCRKPTVDCNRLCSPVDLLEKFRLCRTIRLALQHLTTHFVENREFFTHRSSVFTFSTIEAWVRLGRNFVRNRNNWAASSKTFNRLYV